MADGSAKTLDNETCARSLGEEMRAIRESARASIEQAERDLRIKAKYIEAMEAGDVASLPSRVYADGFLRNYAVYLGLDPEEAVRRFYAEAGVDTAKPKKRRLSKPLTQKVTVDPLAGITGLNRERKKMSPLRRGAVAMWPLVLVGGLGFGAYAGYNIASDAGVLPPVFGEKEAVTAQAEPVSTGYAAETAEAVRTPDPDDKSIREPEVRVAALDDAQMVGEETSRTDARPDTLSYARGGDAPYWLAKPPSVQPVDGPVSEIEPETAGVVERDDDEPAERSRWSARGGARELVTPTPADASRIAAEALAALGLGGNAFGGEEAESDAPNQRASYTGLEQEPDFGAAAGAIVPAEPAQDLVVTENYDVAPNEPAPGTITIAETVEPDPVAADLEPAIVSEPLSAMPAQAQRRFALHAMADSWVQIQDSTGRVTYTGILSPGEVYAIPDLHGLQLKTGNAGGLYIEVDGQRFGPLGNDGAIMRNVPLDPGAIRASYAFANGAGISQ